MVGMPVRVGMAPYYRNGRLIASMRSERSGMETGQDHREEDEKGDEQTHAALASALWAL